MNEVIKASIAGIGFTFDIAAFEELSAYIDKLEKGYRGNPDGREIITDIEARIVEIILSKQPVEEIVGQALVREAIEQMGTPDDLEEVNAGDRKTAYDTADTETKKFPKRMYRNKDGAILGGVCNGIGTFFNIDPVWIRLTMFIPLLLLIILPTLRVNILLPFLGALFGAFVLLYIILWIVVPLARTPRQKLEMRGEKITASSIQRSIREEAGYMPEEAQKSASVFSKIFLAIGQIILLGIKFFALLICFSLAMAALGIFIAIIVAIIYPAHFTICNLNLSEFQVLLANFEGISVNGYAALLLSVALIPLVMIAYQIARLVFKFKNNRLLMWILAIGWLVTIAYTGVVTVRNIDTIKSNAISNYGTMMFLKRHVDINDLGTVVINGDTIIHDGSIKQMDRFIEKLGTMANTSVSTKLGNGKFSIHVKIDKDSTNEITEIRQTINDSINGNNQ